MSKYFPLCIFAAGALLLAHAFSTPGQQIIAAGIGGNLISVSFIVGFYEYLLRRK